MSLDDFLNYISPATHPWSQYALYCILFTLGTTSVIPTLWGTFIFDDGEAILKNGDVIPTNSETSIWEVFKHDFWGVELTHPQSHKSYRPFTIMTFRWDYAIWGNNPFPFHLINLITHGINCILVYHFLLECIFPNGRRKSFDPTSFWATVIFSVHPIHVEPLGGLVGRADLISSFIFLSAFILRSKFNRKLHSTIFVAIAAIVGSLFKENAIVLVIFSCAFDILIRRNLKKEDMSNYLVSFISISAFVLFRIWLQDGPPIFQPFDNPAMFAPTYFSKISSLLYIWILNVFILVCPIWLCYDWSMGCVNLITSPFDIRFVIVLNFICLGLKIVFQSLKSRILLISLLIFATAFLPSSNLIFTVGFVIAERNLYLPSIGYSLLVSNAFVRKRKSWLIFIAVIFFLRSVHRSTQWTNQNLLFSSGLEVCPNNAKIHYNLGTMYGETGNVTMAVQSYRKALELRPDYYQSMNNLGNILRSSGNLAESEIWLRKALSIKGDFAAAWMNLGIVLSKQNVTEAMECYNNALKFRRFYPDCEYNLGNLYLDMGEKDLALKAWMKTISLKATHAQAWINILIMLEQTGKLIEAKEWGIRASKILPEEDTLQFLLGNILGKLEEYEEARQYFEKSIKMCTTGGRPVPSKYWSNLGVLYHRWGKKSEAISCYEEALKLDSALDSARKNLKLLKN